MADNPRHDQDLLSDVFEVAYLAMVDARGHKDSIHHSEYIDVEQVLRAARAGAEDGARDLFDKARTENK